MKILKRLTACILTVMLMSMMFVINASAAAELPADNSGTLTLEKYAENSNKGTPVTGAVFTAYEVMKLDRNTGKYTVTQNFSGVAGLSDELQLNGLTYKSTDELQGMVNTLHDYALDKSHNVVNGANGAVYTSNEGTTGEYTFTGMDLGIYLVVETTIPSKYTASSQSFLVAIPEWDNTTGAWNANVTAYPKDKPINIVKTLTDSAQTDYQIGDRVGFTITSDVPQYGEVGDTSKFVYYISDTMSEGLTFAEDSLNVKVAGKSLSKGTDYTINTESTEIDGATFKLTFPWDTIKKYQGKQIVVTYDGILNENAVVGAVANSKNSNKAKLTYTHSFNTGDDTEEDIDTTEVDVYTYGMELTKTFNGAEADGTEINASGVEFSMKKDGAAMNFAEKNTEAGVYTVYTDDMGTLSGYSEKTTVLKPNSEGVLKINGLDAGTYTLTEEKSLDGYSKLAGSVEIVVAAGANGQGEVSATVEGSGVSNKNDNAGIFEFTVNNVSKQFDLPLTGGTGLLIFTIGGGVIMAAAIIIFSQLRKKKSAK